MKKIELLYFIALLCLSLFVSCKKDGNDDGNNDDLCTVSDSLPTELPGWTIKGTYSAYGFPPGNLQYRFLTAQEGYALGGSVLRTTDGGATWQENNGFPRPQFSYLRVLDVADSQTWFVVADTLPDLVSSSTVQVMLTTTDGGQTWTQKTVSDWILSYVRFRDTLHGYAWGFDATAAISPVFLRTNDGGTTWTPVQGLSQPTAYSRFVVQWLNDDLGLAHNGYDVAYATDDGGQTWRDVSTPATEPLVDYRFGLTSYFGFDGNNLTQYTTNNGQNWTTTYPGSVLVLSIDGPAGLGIITKTSCPNQQPGELALATSTDEGRTWVSTRLISNFSISNLQEVRPGLVVCYDDWNNVFYSFEKN